MVLLGSTDFWDKKQVTHLLEWKSTNIHRKVASTLAAEANGASMAYDRSMYVRALCAEIEKPFSASFTARVWVCEGLPNQQAGKKHANKFLFA